jgi:hypothetical protein
MYGHLPETEKGARPSVCLMSAIAFFVQINFALVADLAWGYLGFLSFKNATKSWQIEQSCIA